MASVVYEGVAGGGSLFEGMKFFITQRVPQRKTWLDLIKANGGDEVRLEKQADILIVDHARKIDLIPGSHSWTFIRDSVKNGKLEDREKHRAGPAAGTVRQVGALTATRTSRTPFTVEDDRILAEFVAVAERRGQPVKGNAIYQELEKLHPRHTSQSWRDRWIKFHANKPRPDVNFEVHTPIFTAGEFEELRNVYEDIMNIDDLKLVDAWQEWALNHPQHTAQQWQDFWEHEVKPFGGRQYEAIKDNKPEAFIDSADNEKATFSASVPHVVTASPSSARETAPSVHLDSLDAGTEEEAERRIMQEARFKFNLSEFAKQQGYETEFNPIVSKHRITLMMLFQVVNQPEFGGFDQVDAQNKWSEVATALNFPTPRHPSVLQELRTLYEEKLAEFAYARSVWRQLIEADIEAGNELTQEDKIDYELITPVRSQALVGVPNLPLMRLESPASPVPFRGEFPEGSQLPDFIPRKRQKRDGTRTIRTGKERELEIPSTPDAIIGTRMSGDNLEILSPHETSPVGNFNRHDDHLEDDNEEEVEEMSELHFSKNNTARNLFGNVTQANREPPVEPETQDFHYTFNTQNRSHPSRPSNQRQFVFPAEGSITFEPGDVHENSSTKSQIDSQRNDQEIRQYIDHHISLGYTEEVVRTALTATTLEKEGASIVMEELTKGAGIPEDMKGVWTEIDDEVVRSGNNAPKAAREVVMSKHGAARFHRRKQFLHDVEVVRNNHNLTSRLDESV